MSLLKQLKAYPGARRQPKRKGRGKGSGLGGTSGRGHKGQRARKSGNRPAGFEGGSMPLARRLPKFGWTNAPFKKRYEIVNLSRLKGFESEVSPQILVEKGWIRKNRKLKILAKGAVSKPLHVRAHHFSKKAKQLIEKAGGRAHIL